MSPRLRFVSGLVTLVVISAAVACSSPPRGGRPPTVSAGPSADKYGVTQTALDPRVGDTTAARPAGANPPAAADPAAVPPTIGTSTPSADKDPAEAQPTAPGAAIGPAEPPKKIGARHVLVQWMGSERAGKSVLRSREQALVLAQEVLQRAKAGEDLARLAVDYSDEPGAGTRGGSLGRFGKGQMVGAFEQVAFKLKVGEISEIVETPFGFHIIQRTE